MKTTIGPTLAGLLATLALPCAVRAETAGTIAVDGPYQRFALAGPGSETFGVNLQRGQGYGLTVGSDENSTLTFTVRAADGFVVATAVEASAEEAPQGFSFRATYTGTYFVDVATGVPAGGVLAVWSDCLATWQTNCSLPVGTTLTERLYNYEDDTDWYRTYLKAGVRYQFTSGKAYVLAVGDGGKSFATKGDPNGAPALALNFTAPHTGTYYLAVGPVGGEVRYQVFLRRR
jgi:hypothetical protein